jgi:hypothetical protein
MRFTLLPAFLAFWIAVLAPAQDDSGLAGATAEVEKLRALVAEGVAPRAKLEQAEEMLADARDAAYLRRTLYGPDLTEQEAGTMLDVAIRRLARRQAELSRQETLVAAGAVSRLSLSEPLEAVDLARRELDLAVSRAGLVREIAEATRAEAQLAEMLEASPGEVPGFAERFDGDGSFSAIDLVRLESAFRQQFARPLPISARGQTPVHASLGFDHRDRIDVAVHPDRPEGLWLRRYLESNRIPFFAFRASAPGKSTGPHIHVGPLSPRIVKGG